jgi:hypothetical protein
MKNSITLLSLFLFFSINVCGQNSTQNQEESLGGIENPEMAVRINLDSITLPKSK